MDGTSVAFVGTVGGVGTTRTVMELGGLLATSKAAVCCLDLDFTTQGLGHHVEGRVGVEASTLLAEPDADLEDAIRDWPVDGEGSLGVIPSLAPFVTIAEAKSETAGARVEDRLDEATERADWVLLDVPPVVSNQAIGAVTAADRTIAVIPPSERGVDALQRERGRLADVGSSFDEVLAVGAGDAPPDATSRIPSLPADAPAHRPATVAGFDGFRADVTQAANAILGTDIDLPESGGLRDRIETVGDRFGV